MSDGPMERYRAVPAGNVAEVHDDHRRGPGSLHVIARCGRLADAAKIARALNQPEGAVEERDALRAEVDRLRERVTANERGVWGHPDQAGGR